jgi:hypothetical protein
MFGAPRAAWINVPPRRKTNTPHLMHGCAPVAAMPISNPSLVVVFFFIISSARDSSGPVPIL